MSTQNKVDSKDQFLPVPDGDGLRIGIVVAEWNNSVTYQLLEGAVATCKQYNVSTIDVMYVSGAFELINGATRLLNINGIFCRYDAVIVIGAVIRGGTPHFDYICQGVTYGIARLNTKYPDCPTIFCVLTTDTLEDAQERAGGSLGNKGVEAAETAIKMCRPLIEKRK